MNDLRELLATRETLGDTVVLHALRDGLAPEASRSGSAAPLHTLLQGYFALDETATTRSFTSAFRRHRDSAQALLAMLEEDGEAQAAGLMRSLLEGRPKPTGALQAGLTGDAARQQAAVGGPAVLGAFAAFASTALATEHSSAEIEMSLAWAAVEGGLLDRVAQAADVLDFAHGPEHRAQRGRLAQLDALVARSSIGEMLGAIATASRPRVLAQPSEYAVANEGAPAHRVEIPVRHEWGPPRPRSAAPAADPAVRALDELYAAADGAALFIPLAHVPQEPGLFLIAAAACADEREQLMSWLTMGVEPDELPAWAHSLVPVAALNGDAARWVVPLEGPHAGSVMLSPDDVHEGTPRYPSLAHFIAALRLCPEVVLGNGGYVSYVVPEHEHLLYPVGHVESDRDGGAP